MLSSIRVVRFGGLMGVLAGAIGITHGLILILLQPHFWAASSFYDYLSIALTSSGFLALVGGLVGLHARQTRRCGKLEGLEKISFFLAVLGVTVASVANVAEDWLHIPFMGWGFIAGAYSLLLGLLLLAITTLRANVLPRWYGWTLLVGSLGILLNNLLANGGMLLFGLIWIVLGYALWKDQTGVPVPSEAVHQETLLHRGEARR